MGWLGSLPLRIDAALHRRVAIAAGSHAKSVNAGIADALEAAAEPMRNGTTEGPQKRKARSVSE